MITPRAEELAALLSIFGINSHCCETRFQGCPKRSQLVAASRCGSDFVRSPFITTK